MVEAFYCQRQTNSTSIEVGNCKYFCLCRPTILEINIEWFGSSKMRTMVSVIIAVYNEEKTIARTLLSILNNPFNSYEIIVIDDSSSDDTGKIAESFVGNFPVRVFKNKGVRGPSGALNYGVQYADSDFLFFIGGDCLADRHWIQRGLDAFTGDDVVAVEGAIHYAAAVLSFTHKVPVNPFYNLGMGSCLTVPGQDYANGNFAIRNQVFKDIGGFDYINFPFGREDTDLGYRATKHGSIAFEARMKVTHAEEFWTLKSLMNNANRYGADVLFYKRHRTFPFMRKRILHPLLLLLLIFPPYILFRFQFRQLKDVLFIPAFYVYLVRLRWCIWKSAVKERVLLI